MLPSSNDNNCLSSFGYVSSLRLIKFLHHSDSFYFFLLTSCNHYHLSNFPYISSKIPTQIAFSSYRILHTHLLSSALLKIETSVILRPPSFFCLQTDLQLIHAIPHFHLPPTERNTPFQDESFDFITDTTGFQKSTLTPRKLKGILSILHSMN